MNIKKHRKHLIGGFGSKHFFFFLAMYLCLAQRYTCSLVQLNSNPSIGGLTLKTLFCFLICFFAIKSMWEGYPVACVSFFPSLIVFLRGVYLKIVSCFPFRLSGSFKIPKLEIIVSVRNDTDVHAHAHTGFKKKK